MRALSILGVKNEAAFLLEWLAHPERIAALQPKYLQLHEALRQDASARAADAVAELLGAAETEHLESGMGTPV